MAAPRLYKKLPGTGRGFLSASFYQLYAGPDHLMQVESNRISEKYRRFYYSDIHGFSVTKTKGGAITCGMLLGVLLAFAGAGWYFREIAAVTATAGVFALICAVLLVLDLLRGPTCRTRLFTSVSNEDVPSLNRLRRMRKVMGRLAPLIESAQGGPLDPADYTVEPAAFASGIPPYGRAGAVIHTFLAAVLVEAMLVGMHVFETGFVLTLVTSLLLAGGLALAVVALVSVHRRRVRAGLKGAVWAGTLFFALLLIVGYVLMVYVQLQKPGSFLTIVDLLKNVTAPASVEAPSALGLLALSSFGLGAGLAGLFFTRPGRR